MFRFLVLSCVFVSSSSCAVALAGSLLAARAVDEDAQYQRRVEAEALYRKQSALEAAEIRRRWNAANPKAEPTQTLSAPPLMQVEPVRQPLRPKLATK